MKYNYDLLSTLCMLHEGEKLSFVYAIQDKYELLWVFSPKHEYVMLKSLPLHYITYDLKGYYMIMILWKLKKMVDIVFSCDMI